MSSQPSPKTIAVLGTLDSKGDEHAYVAGIIRNKGHRVLLIDVGSLEPPKVTPDITREEVAAAAGVDLDGLRARQDRGESVTAMAGAAAQLLVGLVSAGKIDGVISLGGGGGTAIGTAAMRALPVGFPKVMVSTLAAGNVAPYVGTKDIVMFPSIVDVSGLNRLSRVLLARAAGAICGMVEVVPPVVDEKPLIVASMFGNTTQCVSSAKQILEDAGYEVLVFHSTGIGGRIMESLIESGLVTGVLDVTTTEWADELVGGILGSGPTRLEAAGKAGVPAVVAPGCLDMVNFGEPATVPAKFAGRLFYQHNPQVTLMRTNAEENAELGRILAEKMNAYTAPATLLLPLRGVSVISAEGGSFYRPAADQALFEAVRQHVSPGLPVLEVDATINDPAFAKAAAEALLKNIEAFRQAS
ncbi:Tm-1-like ATP-binding domain-containing protein [Verrucomicrobium sp. BvORR106]|uniref:Tm-1-like ATP-binding domain-containing protein n=1 Tax=Verrucomicrobium sp. BvORR106 TaxID=1403819 RepID=UPI000570FC86|nr:Tm-1-like ATP-binding domain-containing protein [Verrucomicrobium sp. BvORR106]